MKRQWHALVIEAYKYPQFVSDWSAHAINAAIRRKLIEVAIECTDDEYCVDVLHITNKGKQWIRMERRK